jgi:hypothetical protein
LDELDQYQTLPYKTSIIFASLKILSIKSKNDKINLEREKLCRGI